MQLGRPMLAAQYDPQKLKLPVYVQPKLDGIRCLVHNGVGYSRTLKPIPNESIQSWIRANAFSLQGFDGELMVGDPRDKDVYNRTQSGVMTIDGEPDFKLHVFDLWEMDAAFKHRKSILEVSPGLTNRRVELVHTTLISAPDILLEYEQDLLSEGYEGIILRSPEGLYKNGRSTTNQGWLIKVKRFTDAEAYVIGFEEKMHNANEAQKDVRGYTVRTAHQANLIPAGTLGALICQLSGSPVTFGIGTGFDDAARQEIWDHQEKYLGKLVKFKHFEVGAKDAPRFPVFLGWRDPIDVD